MGFGKQGIPEHGKAESTSPPTIQSSFESSDKDQTPLNAWINGMAEKKWRTWNVLCGGGLGLLIGVILFVFADSEAYGSECYLLITVLVLVLPNFLEHRIDRKMDVGRYTMAGVVALFVLVAGLLYLQKRML